MPQVRHSTVQVGPANLFYREAGTPGQQVLLLLHGFANSSHYFRHLMPKLAGRFHLIAPDLPSFGFTTIEEGAGYQFTFAGLTETIQGFVNELSLRRFAMYVFDYGAPVSFNLAVANPDSVTNADVRFLDTGHFALETNVDDFASEILKLTVNA
jgi:pimeloyl-ACP methyl ester carboxylesterase